MISVNHQEIRNETRLKSFLPEIHLTFNRGFAWKTLHARNNSFFFPLEQMFFLMQIIFIVQPSNMAAMQNLYIISE